MNRSGIELALLMPEQEMFADIPKRACIKRYRKPGNKHLKTADNVFVFVPISRLESVTPFIRTANETGNLRWIVLDVSEKEDKDLLPTYLNHVKMRNLRNLLIHDGPEIPWRIVNAYCIGAESHLIADATLINDRLFVVSCSAETYEVPIEDIAQLRSVADNERGNFTIAKDGSHIEWPDHDIHLDLDSIRFAVDEDFRIRATVNSMKSKKETGRAIAILRKRSDLRQSDIAGLSERQVRRIEHGEGTTIDSYRHLAVAHGLDINEYLTQVACIVAEGRHVEHRQRRKPKARSIAESIVKEARSTGSTRKRVAKTV